MDEIINGFSNLLRQDSRVTSNINKDDVTLKPVNFGTPNFST